MFRNYKDYNKLLNFSTKSKYTFKYLSDEELKAGSCGEILNSEDFNLKNEKEQIPVTAGLYDTKIFGSIDRCFCGRTRNEGFCPYCKTRVMKKEDYEKQYAFYQLKSFYSYAFKLKLLINILYDIGIRLLNEKVTESSTKEEYIINYIWSLSFEPYSKPPSAQKTDKYDDVRETIDAVYYRMLDPNGKYSWIKISYITKNTPKDYIGLNGLFVLNEFTFRRENLKFIKNYVNTTIYISSPASRPPKFTKQGGKLLTVFPSIHITYKTIIELDKILREKINDVKNSIDFATYLAINNILINRLGLNTELLASSKQSLLRKSTAIRLARTIRGNISPNNSLELDEVGIPRSSAYLALQAEIIEKLREDKDPKIALNAEYYFFKQHPKAEKILHDLVDGSCVLFQRSPVLFKYGVMAFRPVLIESDKPVLQINPLVATPFNADYDGDQMMAIFEIDKYNARRYLQKMSPRYIWTFDRGAPMFVPEHEILVGLIYASNIVPSSKSRVKRYTNFDQVIKDIENKKIEIDEEIYVGRQRTSYGRYRLDDILGTPLDKILGEGEIISSNNIAKIVSGLGKKKNRLIITNQLIDISNEFATRIGIETPPRLNLYKALDPKIQEIKNDNTLTEEQKYVEINKTIEEGLKEQIKKLPNSNFDLLFKSSGRVKMQQLRGLYARRITMEEGKTVVADSEIMSGLSERDLYGSAYEAREVFTIKKSNVPVAGYNTRQITVLVNNIKYSPENAPVLGIIKVPTSEVSHFEGRDIIRQDSKFTYYRSMVGRPIDGFIYANEIRKEKFIKKIEDAMGEELDVENYLAASFSTEILEAVSQGLLGLKYGSDLEYVENEFSSALFDGKVVSITEDELIVSDGQKEWKYILTEVSQIAGSLKEGVEFKKGDKLIVSSKVRQTADDAMPISQFLGFQIAGDRKTKEDKSVSYAIEDGLVHYSGKSMTCGKIRQTINQKLIYMYPEGWRCKYGDRITSGILDTKKLMTYGKPEDFFFIFYKEFHEILSKRTGWGRKFDPEFLEPMYKVITDSKNVSIKSMTRENKQILDSMYGGSPKQAFRTATINNPVDTKTKSKQEYEMTYISDLLLRLNNFSGRLLVLKTPTGGQKDTGISYDIKDSWIKGLDATGYKDLANIIKLKYSNNKKERMDYLRRVEAERYPNLFNDMENWWLDRLNNFIKINKIDSSNYLGHYYDEIFLKKKLQQPILNIDNVVFVENIKNENFNLNNFGKKNINPIGNLDLINMRRNYKVIIFGENHKDSYSVEELKDTITYLKPDYLLHEQIDPRTTIDRNEAIRRIKQKKFDNYLHAGLNDVLEIIRDTGCLGVGFETKSNFNRFGKDRGHETMYKTEENLRKCIEKYMKKGKVVAVIGDTHLRSTTNKSLSEESELYEYFKNKEKEGIYIIRADKREVAFYFSGPFNYKYIDSNKKDLDTIINNNKKRFIENNFNLPHSLISIKNKTVLNDEPELLLTQEYNYYNKAVYLKLEGKLFNFNNIVELFDLTDQLNMDYNNVVNVNRQYLTKAHNRKDFINFVSKYFSIDNSILNNSEITINPMSMSYMLYDQKTKEGKVSITLSVSNLKLRLTETDELYHLSSIKGLNSLYGTFKPSDKIFTQFDSKRIFFGLNNILYKKGIYLITKKKSILDKIKKGELFIYKYSGSKNIDVYFDTEDYNPTFSSVYIKSNECKVIDVTNEFLSQLNFSEGYKESEEYVELSF